MANQYRLRSLLMKLSFVILLNVVLALLGIHSLHSDYETLGIFKYIFLCQIGGPITVVIMGIVGFVTPFPLAMAVLSLSLSVVS